MSTTPTGRVHFDVPPADLNVLPSGLRVAPCRFHFVRRRRRLPARPFKLLLRGGDIGYVAMLRDPDGHVVEFTFGQPIAGLA